MISTNLLLFLAATVGSFITIHSEFGVLAARLTMKKPQ